MWYLENGSISMTCLTKTLPNILYQVLHCKSNSQKKFSTFIHGQKLYQKTCHFDINFKIPNNICLVIT